MNKENKMEKTIQLTNGDTVVMVCPSVKAVKNAAEIENPMEQMIHLISTACHMNQAEIESLPFPDYAKLAVEMNSFLG